MNCNNFEGTIKDLAREQMLEAATRNTARAHIEECELCAKRLDAERALTVGLRRLAFDMQDAQVPASLEANLLARFRERSAQQQQTSPVVVALPQRTLRWQRFVPQAIAAALLLMFAIGGAVTLNMWRGQSSDAQPGVVASGNKVNIQATPAGLNKGPAANGGEEVVSPEIAKADDSQAREPGQKLSKNEVDAIMGEGARARNSFQNVPRSQVRDSRRASTSPEIMTEFMPVAYGDNLNEIENGRIVRVEVPRSALAQFGLPVNMDRANERVKADVLIGDDGMARAIRFVR